MTQILEHPPLEVEPSSTDLRNLEPSRIRIRSDAGLGIQASLIALNHTAVNELGRTGEAKLRSFLVDNSHFMHDLPRDQWAEDLFSEGQQYSVRPPLSPEAIQKLADAMLNGEITAEWHPDNVQRRVEVIDNDGWSPETPYDKHSSVTDHVGKVLASSALRSVVA